MEAPVDVTKKSDLTVFYQNLVTKNVAFASNRLAEGEAKTEARSEPLVESADAEPSVLTSDPIPAVVEKTMQRVASFEKTTKEGHPPSGTRLTSK